MQLRCVVVFVLFAQLGRAQSITNTADTAGIDLGWVAAVQHERGWQVVNAPDPPSTYKGTRHLQIGDVLLTIDGHDASRLGPLAVARIFEDVPIRKVPVSAYSDDVNGVFQRDVNNRSGDVNKVGAKLRWDCNHA